MFSVDQLARFEVTSPTYRLLKPWWDVCTDYLATAMVLIAVFSGAMQATQRNLFCLPAVDCNFERNQSMKAPGNNSFCRSYDYSATRSSTMTVLIKLQDSRQYDFVEAECGQKAVHWFASYFPLIIFIQAIMLKIVDNFWLKFPQTSSILEHFVTLVIECYNTPGTSSALSNALWGTDLSKENAVLHDIEELFHERPPDTQPLELSEASKVKTLYEKMRQFRIDVEEKRDLLTLRGIYVAQAITQSALSLCFITVNASCQSKLNKTVKCNIDDIISENYNYFKCSNVVVSYFQITLVIFYFLIVPYFLSCIYMFYWTFSKIKKTYNFRYEHPQIQNFPRLPELHDVVETHLVLRRRYILQLLLLLQLSEIQTARGDLAFMFYLLDEYSKLYSLRSAVFLSDMRETKLEDYLRLNAEWSIEKLQMHTKDRTLKLTNLCSIPKAVFEMEELNSLILDKCTLTYHQDFDREDWRRLSLTSLSLISCFLTSIPAVILELRSLKTLDLSGNSISSIPVNIKQLHSLSTLNIAGNKVTEGVEGIFEMKNLRVLNLRENNSLVLQLPSCPLSLTKLYVDEAMVAKMTEETKNTLRDVIETNVPRARDISVMQYSRAPADRAPHIPLESHV